MLREEEAKLVAANHSGKSISDLVAHTSAARNPMFWKFSIGNHENAPCPASGEIVMDSLDGRIWETDELAEYLHDYNNLLDLSYLEKSEAAEQTNNRCDIFLPFLFREQRIPSILAELKTLQPNFSLNENAPYNGFLGLDLPRLKAVSVVRHLRERRIGCCSVPLKYKYGPLLSEDEAKAIAAEITGSKMILSPYWKNEGPMSFIFRIGDLPYPVYEGGGLISIDRLDGHRWEGDEEVEYMHDYNGQL